MVTKSVSIIMKTPRHNQVSAVSALKPTRSLPDDYVLIRNLDLSQNLGIMVLLSLASLVMFVVSGFFFQFLARLIHPSILTDVTISFSGSNSGSFFNFLLFLFLVVVVMIILHEGIHGLFFWLFTGDRPKFGFKGSYAYAAAPSWYLPKNAYLMIALSPLVILSGLGLAALMIVPTAWIPAIILFITLNASGAVGDIYVTGWLLKHSEDLLIQDFGDRMHVYTQGGFNEDPLSKHV